AITKQVIVHADSTTIPGVVLGASEILDLVIAPNPNMGVFSVNVTLANPQPFTLTLYRESGEQLARRETDGLTTVTEAFDLDLVPGTYFLQAQAGGERRMVAVIVQ
ncbi:MAG: T9SS type A sorting domain-containing protein, partial [Bacteroidota bacterium]